jgi:hypothetical protein
LNQLTEGIAHVATNVSDELRASALAYHRYPNPGKLEIQATKPLGNQRDLALAYSPGVAVACEAIAEDPSQAAHLTARQNLVAVLTNGTAVLTTVYCRNPVLPLASVAETVNVKLPVAVTIPDISPVPESDNPLGSIPELTAKRIVPTPPAAVSCWLTT